MHTAQLLSQALELSRQVGFQIREEALDGAGGGHCLIRGQKWLLLDLTQSHQEQLNDVIDALRCEPQLDPQNVPASLVKLLPISKAA